MTSLKKIFDKAGAKAMQIAPGVQEAAFACAVHYTPLALRLVS